MAWKTAANAALGLPQPGKAALDTVAQLQIGTVAGFVEDTQGAADLIYLPGVAALAVGDAVTYDLTPGSQSVTRHLKDAFPNSGRPVAFAVDAPLAGQFGWFQTTGTAIVSAVAATAVGPMFGSATAGSVSSTADAGDQILSARITTAVGTPIANKVYAEINSPFIQGQIT